MPFSLADAIFWVAVACCSIAQLAIVYSAVVSPARVPSAAEPTSSVRRVGEIACAALPGIALAAVFVVTWHAMHPLTIAEHVMR